MTTNPSRIDKSIASTETSTKVATESLLLNTGVCFNKDIGKKERRASNAMDVIMCVCWAEPFVVVMLIKRVVYMGDAAASCLSSGLSGSVAADPAAALVLLLLLGLADDVPSPTACCCGSSSGAIGEGG